VTERRHLRVTGTVKRRHLRVTGTVQGVGFRPFVYRLAVELELAGRVSNDSLGVLIEAEGSPDALDALSRRLIDEAPPLAVIASLSSQSHSPRGERGFAIVDSRASGLPAVAVSVDAATCDQCLAELHDPHDRRYRYPFINCTNCGPRYTIIYSVPYDRASTTMAGFAMCPPCRREYEDPGDRRFHAEPIACAACGPRVALVSSVGDVLSIGDDALAHAVTRLEAGQILAVKGLGGFHLATDATSAEAVDDLRRRKARDDKPFAVMAPTLADARRLASLTPEAEQALSSPRRPIVLVPRLEPSGEGLLAPSIAPGLTEIGLMVAYTPLHHLLLEGLGRPLIMTSGNRSDEPIAHDDRDAIERLGPMVDAIVTHDRPIHIRADDSVVRARGQGRPIQVLRRARGFAPEPIALRRQVLAPVLAVGAELKNTVAVAKGTTVVASHHIGDLEHLAAYRSFLQAIDHLCSLTGVVPALVAHDLHPEYLSTKYASDLDLPLLGVQHHHAHIASCLAEHGREDRVLGLAFDGTGFGPDGSIWGGEFLVADLDGYKRVGHLAGVALVGGNQAVREPWRLALSWIRAACGHDEAARFGRETDPRWAPVLALVEGPEPLITTSAGRLFDAVASIIGVRHRVNYEAQAAIELEAIAAAEPVDTPFECEPAIGWVDGSLILDPAPVVAQVVAGRRLRIAPSVLAAAFHSSLAKGLVEAAAQLAADNATDTVALSGGVFQNARLATLVERDLTNRGLEVLTHSQVPPNDGGISIGQAAIAARHPCV